MAGQSKLVTTPPPKPGSPCRLRSPLLPRPRAMSVGGLAPDRSRTAGHPELPALAQARPRAMSDHLLKPAAPQPALDEDETDKPAQAGLHTVDVVSPPVEHEDHVVGDPMINHASPSSSFPPPHPPPPQTTAADIIHQPAQQEEKFAGQPNLEDSNEPVQHEHQAGDPTIGQSPQASVGGTANEPARSGEYPGQSTVDDINRPIEAGAYAEQPSVEPVQQQQQQQQQQVYQQPPAAETSRPSRHEELAWLLAGDNTGTPAWLAGQVEQPVAEATGHLAAPARHEPGQLHTEDSLRAALSQSRKRLAGSTESLINMFRWLNKNMKPTGGREHPAQTVANVIIFLLRCKGDEDDEWEEGEGHAGQARYTSQHPYGGGGGGAAAAAAAGAAAGGPVGPVGYSTFQAGGMAGPLRPPMAYPGLEGGGLMLPPPPPQGLMGPPPLPAHAILASQAHKVEAQRRRHAHLAAMGSPHQPGGLGAMDTQRQMLHGCGGGGGGRWGRLEPASGPAVESTRGDQDDIYTAGPGPQKRARGEDTDETLGYGRQAGKKVCLGLDYYQGGGKRPRGDDALSPARETTQPETALRTGRDGRLHQSYLDTLAALEREAAARGVARVQDDEYLATQTGGATLPHDTADQES